jgi:hypothetical protein
MKSFPLKSNIWKNTFLLYLVTFLSILNVLGYIARRKTYYVLFFGLIAAVSYGLTKNPVFSLFVAILMTNILLPLYNMSHIEGMENKKDAKGLQDSESVKKPGKESVPVSDDEPQKMKNAKKPRVDYASTVEGAYKDLSSILKSDGIKNLTKDTKVLMDQQMQLAEAMQGMGPLIENAKSMLQQIDLKGLNFGGNSQLGEMVKKFGFGGGGGGKPEEK